MSAFEDWTAALRERAIPVDPVVAGWLDALVDPREAPELEARVALHARTRGEAGMPPSSLLLALDLLIAAADRPDRREALLRVAADGYAVGLAMRHQDSFRELLRDTCPVIALPGGRVLVAPVGPFDATEVIDSAFGRAIELAAASRSREIVLSLASTTAVDEELLQVNLRAWRHHELASRVRIILSGVDERWHRWVEESQLAPQVRCEPQLHRLAPEAL